MTLAGGKSCLLSIDYIADSDFGLNQWNLCAEVGGQPDAYTHEYFLTIQDAPVTSREPSSLLTGFVGLFGSLRRTMLWRSIHWEGSRQLPSLTAPFAITVLPHF
jgi:hypothetical protein